MSEPVTATDVATAKARTWGEIRVEMQSTAPPANPHWTAARPEPFDSVTAAHSWIEANGKDAALYRIVRVVQTVKVKAQNVRKVELETV